ncbi:MAG: winged helix-turn-helix transcriptional regulator [Vulcanimicrobiaceae bacterium]
MGSRRIHRPSDGVPRALEIMGERWTMLILRESFHGTRRFDDFRHNLGIATNILTARLQKLVRHGLLQRFPDPGDGRRFDYRLTDKGRDLFPAIVALMQWGERWLPSTNGDHGMRLVAKSDGAPIDHLTVRSERGEELSVRDVMWVTPQP